MTQSCVYNKETMKKSDQTQNILISLLKLTESIKIS